MFEESDNFYPAKPEFIQPEQKSGYIRMLISIALFFVVFITLVSENNYLLAIEVIGILLLHEFGHLAMMKIFGYKSLNMLFIPFIGAFVSGNKIKVSQKQKVWISLMGPMPGILIGLTLFIYALYVQPDYLLVELSLLLLAINVVNIIPLDPLDGGHILETLFFPVNDQARMYFTLFSSVAIILSGVYLGFFPLVIFGFLMAFKVRAYQKNKVIHDDLDDMNLNYRKDFSELSDREYWTIRRVFLENNPKVKELIPDDDTAWENEKLIVEQVNQLLKVEVQRDLSLIGKVLFAGLLLFLLLFPFWFVANNYQLVDWYLNHVGF